MPKRVLDGEGIWGSTKLARCPEWMRAEYAWLYPLADAYGCFELTSIAVIRGKVAPHRTRLTEKRLLQIFDEFHERGLLFIWLRNGRKYGYWTGSDRSGRLPRPSRRSKNYEKVLTPVMPRKELMEYLQGLGEPTERRLSDGDASSASASASASAKALASASVPKDTAQASPSLGFDTFWIAYPRKVGKPSAQRAWRRVWKTGEGDLDGIGMQKILAGIEAWKKTEQWQVETHIPHPATFLNDRRWEDEPPATEHSMESSVGRGPQPKGKIKPFSADVQEKVAESHRQSEIARLEEILSEEKWSHEIKKECGNQLNKLRRQAPVNP